MQQIEATVGFARGYVPFQYCHSNARNPLIWDELEAYIRLHPLYTSIYRLAKARILQALLDVGCSNEALRNMAFNWMFSDQSDFRAWCSDAGLSPKIVRKKARDIIEHGLNWRAAAGEGVRYGRVRKQ